MANVKQVGGNHYNNDYPIWDYWVDHNYEPLLANAIKYVCRYEKKNGSQDLDKCLSYIKKFKTSYDNDLILSFLQDVDGYIFSVDYTVRHERFKAQFPEKVAKCIDIIFWLNEFNKETSITRVECANQLNKKLEALEDLIEQLKREYNQMLGDINDNSKLI